jgi:hypothetical protein
MPAPKDTSSPAIRATADEVRALWLERQGLAPPAGTAIADVVRDTGWLTTAGSHGTYLSLRARAPSLSRRAEVDDAAIEGGSLVEIPTVRRCVMIVPRRDAWLALGAAAAEVAESHQAALEKTGVNAREIDKLSAAVVEALGRGPLSGDEIRAAVPAKLVRSLGEAGRKIGEPTTLSLTLHLLAATGTVERRATKSLVARDFTYRLFDPKPAPPAGTDADPTVELTRRFFAWAGPATRAELAFWLGCTQGVAREAMAHAKLARVTVEGWAKELWMLEKDERRLRRARAGEGVVLLPFRDNLLGFRRGLEGMIDPAVKGRVVAGWENRPESLADIPSLHHHFIVSRGLVVGIWDYDPGEHKVVWGAFGELPAAERKAIDAEADRTAAFVRDELGDLRFYALDSDKNRAARLAAVRRL